MKILHFLGRCSGSADFLQWLKPCGAIACDCEVRASLTDVDDPSTDVARHDWSTSWPQLRSNRFKRSISPRNPGLDDDGWAMGWTHRVEPTGERSFEQRLLASSSWSEA